MRREAQNKVLLTLIPHYKMNKVIVCITLGGLTSLLACHKNDDPQPPTPTQLLVGKKWQLKTSTITASNQPTIDLYAVTASYTKDDFEQYDLPDVATYDEGPTKYAANNQQTKKGTWQLNPDNTRLSVTYGSRTTEYVVEEITASSLKLHINQVQSGGITSVLTNTFVAIP